jgi:hypothetical protein
MMSRRANEFPSKIQALPGRCIRMPGDHPDFSQENRGVIR